MDVRGKLVELLKESKLCSKRFDDQYSDGTIAIIADHLIANGVMVNEPLTHCQQWIPASEPPTEYRDEYGELIPFLVCEEGTEYPFRAMYDGKVWGDGFFATPVTHWMHLPEPPKEG